MKSQVSLGRVFGIKVGLHYSWPLIAVLVAFSLAGTYRLDHPQWSGGFVASLAITSAILFFVCLLLHELSHSLAAKAQGIPVREITLFALGGVSELEGEPASASAEFWMAAVGPFTSAILGLAFLSAVHIFGHGKTPLSPWLTVAATLGYINISLAVFNLLPAYPMDGGRVLRAILWWKNKDMERATKQALRVSQGIAVVLIVLGAMSYFGTRGIGGLWLAFIGWFLLQASRETSIEIGLRQWLTTISVDQLMVHDFPTIDRRETIQHFVDNTLLRTGRRSYLVKNDDIVVGLITPSEIRHLAPAEWSRTSVEAVMRPLSDMASIAPGTSLLKAMRVMGEADVAQLPILNNGRLQGVLSRETVLSYLQTILELKIGSA